jgi:hypothetical protein
MTPGTGVLELEVGPPPGVLDTEEDKDDDDAGDVVEDDDVVEEEEEEEDDDGVDGIPLGDDSGDDADASIGCHATWWAGSRRTRPRRGMLPPTMTSVSGTCFVMTVTVLLVVLTFVTTRTACLATMTISFGLSCEVFGFDLGHVQARP